MSNKFYWAVIIIMLAVTLFDIDKNGNYGFVIWDIIIWIPMSIYQFILKKK